MSSLRDQMLKLGLVDGKQARKAAHEGRVHKKKRGRQGIQADRQAQVKASEVKRTQGQTEDRVREQARQGQEGVKEDRRRVAQIVTSGRLSGRTDGRNRFYFETRDGRVPFLEVNDRVVEGLQQGRVAVVESAKGTVSLIEGESAQRVADLDGSWIRVWQSARAST